MSSFVKKKQNFFFTEDIELKQKGYYFLNGPPIFFGPWIGLKGFCAPARANIHATDWLDNSVTRCRTTGIAELTRPSPILSFLLPFSRRSSFFALSKMIIKAIFLDLFVWVSAAGGELCLYINNLCILIQFVI